MSKHELSRRAFLAASASTLIGCTTLGKRAPAKISVRSPNEIPNLAAIGCAVRGATDIASVERAGANVVALCDVDFKHAGQSLEWWPKAARYSDFRQMLDNEPGVDIVTISTPDHTHCPAALYAMAMGKHVFVQKPLTITVEEAGIMRRAARRYGVATQMGNQGHADEGVRQTCEWIWDGAIGDVVEVYAFTNRPTWAQGIANPLPAEPVPAHLDWENWIGSARMLPYNQGYHPRDWRGFWEFGCGAIGDMGCHILDAPFWALHLGAPATVECIEQEGCTAFSGPTRSRVRLDFPERKVEVRKGVTRKFVPVSLYWYENGVQPEPYAALPEAIRAEYGSNASLFVGTKGMLVSGCYGDSPRLLPDELARNYSAPAPYLERPKDIYHDWMRAVKEGIPACSNFEYSAPLTEMVLLANVAVRAGRKIEWDARKRRITNVPEANQFLARTYRDGWQDLLDRERAHV